MTTQLLIEQIDLSEARLNRDTRVMEGVVLIRAGESANKRNYPADVLQKSVQVFEGVKAYADHPTAKTAREPRSIRDITGWYKNVRFSEGKLIADRVFSNTAAGRDALAIAEDIVNGVAPKGGAGLSINAVGTGKARDDGGVIVEAITYAHSVDDVSSPAAGGGYTESTGGDSLVAALMENMTFEEWRAATPTHVERLKKEWKTVRLEEATKTALAEADQKVKAAEAETGRLQEALDEATADFQEAAAERDAALVEADQARRELLIERTLRKVNIPTAWETSLRDALMKAEPDDWQAIIESEQQKAKTAGHRVPVSGAGQTVTPEQTPAAPGARQLLAQEGEDVEAWMDRIRRGRV